MEDLKNKQMKMLSTIKDHRLFFISQPIKIRSSTFKIQTSWVNQKDKLSHTKKQLIPDTKEKALLHLSHVNEYPVTLCVIKWQSNSFPMEQ